jgi:succinoglycan biosynthesis transport protein ExoP
VTIHDYVRVLREQWLVVALAVVLGAGAALLTFSLRPAQYTATLTMYVVSQGSDSTLSAYQGAQLSQQRVTSYVELVGSRRVAEGVLRQLGQTGDPDDLAEQITASSAVESVLIDVAVEDRDPQRAAVLADAVGDVFSALVDDLERPVQADGRQAVAVRVVQPADVPLEPSSTGLPLTLAIGLVLGLAAGVGVALLRTSLDTSVRSAEQLRRATSAPPLGTIVADPGATTRPLIVHDDPQSPRSEAFRQLRTNLQFVDVDKPPQIVVVTSALPGEGKTTTVANLAVAIGSAGRRVLVVEADLRRPALADAFGLDRAAGLTTVLTGRAELDEVIQPWGGVVHVLASGPLPPNPSELLASRHARELLEALRERYDLVLIDTPPLLPVTDAAAVAPSTDGVLLVCRYGRTREHQVSAAAAALRSVSVPLLGGVLNGAPTRRIGYGKYATYYRSETAGPADPQLWVDAERAVAPNGDHVRAGSHSAPE